MSKSTENILLVPGAAGWEIWSGTTESGFSLRSATPAVRAADVSGVPAGELMFFFPVKLLTAVPMRVTSDDDALFNDLAALHAERLGLRPDPMAGQLTDVFVIAREPENTALVSVLLKTPVDGDLPARGPKEFDISPRAFPITGSRVALWKEFGRWVFAISYEGKFTYSQATSSSAHSPDAAVAREVRLALVQMSMQGIEVPVESFVIWTAEADVTPAALEELFGVPAVVSPRPSPQPPAIRSKLLPDDVRAARKLAARRRSIQLGIAAVALIYVGAIGWFSYGMWKENSETKRLLALADAAAPEGQAYAIHIAKWDELALLQRANSPVDILSRIARCVPPGSGLRFRTAEIGDSGVKLLGEAPQSTAINQFSLKLTQSNDLASFEWERPNAQQSSRGWEFNYSANPAAK